jgi:hypothetical protein
MAFDEVSRAAPAAKDREPRALRVDRRRLGQWAAQSAMPAKRRAILASASMRDSLRVAQDAYMALVRRGRCGRCYDAATTQPVDTMATSTRFRRDPSLRCAALLALTEPVEHGCAQLVVVRERTMFLHAQIECLLGRGRDVEMMIHSNHNLQCGRTGMSRINDPGDASMIRFGCDEVRIPVNDKKRQMKFRPGFCDVHRRGFLHVCRGRRIYIVSFAFRLGLLDFGLGLLLDEQPMHTDLFHRSNLSTCAGGSPSNTS